MDMQFVELNDEHQRAIEETQGRLLAEAQLLMGRVHNAGLGAALFDASAVLALLSVGDGFGVPTAQRREGLIALIDWAIATFPKDAGAMAHPQGRA